MGDRVVGALPCTAAVHHGLLNMSSCYAWYNVRALCGHEEQPMRMHLAMQGDEASFETKISLAAFPHLVEEHMRYYRDPRQLEIFGQELLAYDFPADKLEQFIRQVCSWGGYSGIAGRIFNRNSPIDIRQRFIEAAYILSQESPDIKAALREINIIKGLGTPSFSSKHLRFLFPETCPILDSVNKSLGYTFNAEGYEQLVKDCATIAGALEKAAIPNPMNRPNNRWFAGEIDMALFTYLNG